MSAQSRISSPRFTIHKATGEESAEILECLASAFAPFRESYTPDGFLDTVLSPDTLAQRLKDMDVFVALRADEGIIGTISCKVEHTTLGWIKRTQSI